jgi:transcriptional regulator with XRE-family HTH domain
MEEWRRLIRQTRERLDLSQKRLGELSGLSQETVRKYESGARNPTRQHLIAILEALKIERGIRNDILESAGFAPDGLSLRPWPPDVNFTIDEAKEEVERYAWPAFFVNEIAEVIWANRVAQRLWGVNLQEEFRDPVERNLLSVASHPRFADRCANWDEALGILVAVFKEHHRGAEKLENPSPYFAAVLEHFLQGDPRYVARLAKLWQEAPPVTTKLRWCYPIVWSEPGAGVMRFHCFQSAANEPDGLSFHDWIPLDAATWDALAALAERDAEAPGAAAGR